jgi:hypothetical protein
MLVGRVAVFPRAVPATMTVAPNSPMARAQVRTNAAMIPLLAMGRQTRKNAPTALQPRVLATFS